MTIANQLTFLNYPELLAHTQTSSFDPLDLAKGDTDLFVVAPEETIEHVKGWLRLLSCWNCGRVFVRTAEE